MVELKDVVKLEQKNATLLKPYSIFFSRVLLIAAIKVQEMCQHLQLNDGTSEMIWSVLQVLLAQETDLLVGRHIDQLIICTIYGMCRVHQSTCY